MLIVIHLLINEAISECKTSTITLIVIYGHLFLFMYLFAKFYRQAYSKIKILNRGREVTQVKLQGNKNDSLNKRDARKVTTNATNGTNVHFFIGSKPINSNGNFNKRKLL